MLMWPAGHCDATPPISHISIVKWSFIVYKNVYYFEHAIDHQMSLTS